MPRRRKANAAKALLDVQAAGSGTLSVNTVQQREVQVKGGIRDLESHCTRLQALCNQVQASLELNRGMQMKLSLRDPLARNKDAVVYDVESMNELHEANVVAVLPYLTEVE